MNDPFILTKRYSNRNDHPPKHLLTRPATTTALCPTRSLRDVRYLLAVAEVDVETGRVPVEVEGVDPSVLAAVALVDDVLAVMPRR
ncbi:hypothetical protein NUW54_g12327 [Trametes sanguinea]|uniref:Uncharacterized protein n=1 Tax=Trametes sanguinea TaxID=158606 RepID=A0ACC1MZ97_9APHY|nr:hypothetical protein NUW54_g12327 [Trametes sanguinea]